MLRTLYGIWVAFFKWIKGLFGKITGRQDAVPDTPELFLRRIRRVLDCSGIRQKRGSAGVWIAKAGDFTDAYRFMLRLCAPRYVRCVRQAGHVRYKAVLPDGEGSILLSDRVGNRQNTVAVMKFSVGRLTEWKEIRFAPRRKPPGR